MAVLPRDAEDENRDAGRGRAGAATAAITMHRNTSRDEGMNEELSFVGP